MFRQHALLVCCCDTQKSMIQIPLKVTIGNKSIFENVRKSAFGEHARHTGKRLERLSVVHCQGRRVVSVAGEAF